MHIHPGKDKQIDKRKSSSSQEKRNLIIHVFNRALEALRQRRRRDSSTEIDTKHGK